MRRRNREILRNIILVLLIITTLIQVGILWDYQNHGFPFNILYTFLSNEPSSGPPEKGKYLAPYRVIAFEGSSNDPHFIVDKSYGSYGKLWADAKLYLKNILSSKGLQARPEVLPREKWYQLALNRGIIFEFKSNIKPELLAWLFDSQISLSQDIGGISKIMITPWEDVNSNTNTIYIFDDKKVHKFIVQMDPNGLKIEEYESILKSLSEDYRLRPYYAVGEVFPKAFNKGSLNVAPDILCAVTGSKYQEYENIDCSVPDSILTKKTPQLSELGELGKKILASEKDSYDPAQDMSSGAVIFKNQRNAFRVYDEGLLEYKYLIDTNNTDKGSINRAFEEALEFLEKRMRLVSGVECYLTGVKERENVYEFTFDYYVGGTPVFFNYKTKGQDDKVIKNAITIEANSKRVVNCWWFIRKFERTKEKAHYNVNFEDLMEAISKNNNNLKYSNFSIKDISMSYEVNLDENRQSIVPEWVIKTMQDEYYTLPAEKK